MSLQANGTRAYERAVDHCLDVTAHAAQAIRRHPRLELVLEPSLTVVLLRRLGWREGDYQDWSARAMASGLAFVTPTRHDGESVLRFCFVNPLTTLADVDLVLGDL